MCGLRDSPYFSILADECQDISYSGRAIHLSSWLANGKPAEHFLTVLHVRSTDAGTIAEALQSFLQQKLLDLRKLIGQGCDGPATFTGKISGVHKRIRSPLLMQSTSTVRSCQRLQLASIQAAASVKEIGCVFYAMTSVRKLFYYSPKKSEALKGIQDVPGFPELKIMKPSDTRWLLHEHCVRVVSPRGKAKNHIEDGSF